MQPIFCSVIEPDKNWINAAVLLIQSLRSYGGSFSDSPFALLVNGYPASGEPLLHDTQHQMFIFGNKRHALLPHISKVAALGLVDRLSFTHLILLDHDTMILRLDELTTFLTGEVHARRNYKYSLRRALGKDYARPLAASGLRPWSRIHYFNSGVVIVPCQHCHTLETHWHTWAEQLLTSYRGRPLSEQVGFAMALASGKLPYAFLPMHYNETNWKPPSPEASIIHYNAYDPINREVKKKFLLSFNDFRDFLLQTDNRFWRAHAPAILCLPELELARLAERITTTLQLSQI